MNEDKNMDIPQNNETQNVSEDNSQEIFNLIQSIQTKLNNENNDKSSNSSNEQKTNENTNQQTSNEKTIDSQNSSSNLTGLASLLQNIDISSILNLWGNNTNSNTKKDSSGLNLDSIDPNTILKISRVISSFKQDDPKKNLLLSLKPFLRQSRQDKLGEYVTMLSIANAIGIFTSKGSDDDVRE